MRVYNVPLKPPFWARGGHAQTIWGHVLPSPGRAIGSDAGDTRIEVALPDGDVLVGFRCAPDDELAVAPGERPVRVHLFHGLSGDCNAEYMRRTAEMFTTLGFEVWAFNHRGAGAGAGLARGIYHSGCHDDLAAVLCQSRRDLPEQLQLVIGFSLSGNAALLLAAEWSRAPDAPALCALPRPPDAILAINPPADLEHTSKRIHTGLNRLYERRFVRRLRAALQKRQHEFAGFAFQAIPRGASLWTVDELVTAPLGGFRDARDYYATCSTAARLHQVHVPTVIITAGDDPFVDAARVGGAKRPANVFVHTEAIGGHVGYLARQPVKRLGYTRWLDGALLHYANELIAVAKTHQQAEIDPPIVAAPPKSERRLR